MIDISTLFIQSFRNFSDFKMTFPDKASNKNEKLNLNILVGRNGSGKSNLIDALFEIATKDDLKDCCFDFYIQDNQNKLIMANIDPITKKTSIFPQISEEIRSYWHKVVRFHCSENTRNKENYYGDGQYVKEQYSEDEEDQSILWDIKHFTNKCFDFDIKLSKYAYIALFLSGQYFNNGTIAKSSIFPKHYKYKNLIKTLFSNDIKSEVLKFNVSVNKEQIATLHGKGAPEELITILQQAHNDGNKLWKELESIIIEENPIQPKIKFVPEILWIDVHEGNVFIDEIMPKYSYTKRSDRDLKDGITYFWKVSDLKVYFDNNKSIDAKILLEKYFSSEYCYDAGFLYTIEDLEKNIKSDLSSDTSLSDGQRAFLYRYAIINLLKYEDQRCLLLLDEPETYFNEYWKSYFLYLVYETLKDKPHDVFISTHSAMLLTDAKPEEVHRLINTPQGACHYRPQINTYGVNVVDIGKYLFMMESDIGNRSKSEIINIIEKNPNNLDDFLSKKKEIQNLLKRVGPGEWRWRLRVSLKDVEFNINKHSQNG